MSGPQYICNTCDRRIKFSNNHDDNVNVCTVVVKKDTPEGLVEAKCGMRYERIVTNEATKNITDTRSNRKLAKKAGK